MERDEDKLIQSLNQIIAGMDERRKVAQEKKTELKYTGQWPGIYAEEVRIQKDCTTASYLAGALGGAFGYLGLGSVLRRWPLTRGALSCTCAAVTFSVTSITLLTQSLPEIISLKHSLCAETVCPTLKELLKTRGDIMSDEKGIFADIMLKTLQACRTHHWDGDLPVNIEGSDAFHFDSNDHAASSRTPLGTIDSKNGWGEAPSKDEGIWTDDKDPWQK
ncbi:hypothetical protein CYMTET_42789 [Cymbomonas tetramitiformis]|uniref:Uncharacterized protein n=1 Tax=Cymbomonas tetramitiformis TaxID=36881 RepID=A0AAE0F162_9CHLO|nr:hypothetical protein CYMTET_42789 [Cymbomonas tetramitiformis]